MTALDRFYCAPECPFKRPFWEIMDVQIHPVGKCSVFTVILFAWQDIIDLSTGEDIHKFVDLFQSVSVFPCTEDLFMIIHFCAECSG